MPKPGVVLTKPKDPIKPRLPACKACGGTGRNSKGGDCVPCIKKKEALK